MERLTKIKKWWNEPPSDPVPRGKWITTQLGIILIFGLTLWANLQESHARERDFRHEQQEDTIVNCQQRIDAINSVRVVFLDVYDYAEQNGGDDIAVLRERLDIVLPPLTMEKCLSQYSALDG